MSAALALGVLGALFWMSTQQSPSRTRPPVLDSGEAALVTLPAATDHTSASHVASRPPQGDGRLRAPAARAPSATEELDRHPHPLDDARKRLADEQRLIGALNDAMDLADPKPMRPLIASYRVLMPRDENKLAEGYERIADCLEDPSAAHREAAQEYYDRERASTLRRYVRRHCFER